MQPANYSLVEDIRVTSRELVRQFGFMNQKVAGTQLSLSAVHAIIEIGRAGTLSAKQLSEILLLEKSTVSRLVGSLVERGEILETRSADDQRVKFLCLSTQGKKTLDEIDRYAESQVSGALEHLDKPSRIGVLKGLQDYTAALQAASAGRQPGKTDAPVAIRAGYVPTLVGRVVVMLLTHMHANFGFAAAFESRISADLAEFVSRLDCPRNRIWRAQAGDEIIGSISIDGEDLGDDVAHLRWFVVDERARSTGVGRELLRQALDFCDRNRFRETCLWTVKGLDRARALYESHGFELVEEYYGNQWGDEVLEQKFVRPLAER